MAEFKAGQSSGINTLLGLIYVLLGLAVVIALLGIVNTLALSIFERTHEIGLMRAVGMSRRQTRSIDPVGVGHHRPAGHRPGPGHRPVLRLGRGAGPGRHGINQLAIPVGQLLVVVVLAALAGVVAAILPARRAARLDVLVRHRHRLIVAAHP